MVADFRTSLIKKNPFPRVRFALLQSPGGARMGSFGKLDFLGGVIPRGVLGSMGTLFTVRPCGPNGPPVTGGPLLRPLTVFNSFKVAVSCLPAAEKSDTFETALL